MKIKFVVVLVLLICLTMILSKSSYAQTIEFDTNQSLTVSGPGFFPFSTTANEDFFEVFPTNPNLDVEFTNFTGGSCALAPAADFAEIGPQIIVMGMGVHTLNFSGASPNVGNFGLSFVPQAGPCVFEIFINKPQIVLTSTSSSSGGDIVIDNLNPNALTVFSNFLPDSLVESLSNEDNNNQCSSNPSSINSASLINLRPENLIDTSAFATVPRITRFLSSSADSNTFTLLQTTPKKSKGVYTQSLRNDTDKTKIFVTGIFPSVVDPEEIRFQTIELEGELNYTPKTQLPNLVALAAVQHTLISAGMPWQLGGPNSAFIVQGGGCVGPFCTIVEQGMVTIIPGGACTPEKLNNNKMKLGTVNPSKLFDPFAASQSTIQVPSSSVVNPNHPNVSARVNTQNGYLIIQPVPSGANLKQQLNIQIKQPCQEPVACDKLCSNVGDCCARDSQGNASKICTQTGLRCNCR